MPNVEASPALTRMASVVVLGVSLYLGWISFYNARHHPLATAGSVARALAEIGDPDEVVVTQGAQVFDRGSTIYAQKYFVSKETPQELTSHYVSEFQGKGWRRVGGVSGEDYASTFCKNKLLGTLYFYGARNDGVAFSITVRTGGGAIDVCG